MDLGALAHNYGVLTRILAGRAAVMAMVKADAYGHGAIAVSKELERCGARALGVATVEEGMELREAGVKLPVLVMGGLLGVGSPASSAMVEASLTPVIHSTGVLDSLEAEAKRAGRRVAVHIKVDTGMSRLGARPEALGPLLDHVGRCKGLCVEGVMTHLAQADNESESAEQMRIFMQAKKLIEAAIGRVPIWHVANSGALLRGAPIEVQGAVECWARPGLALYGEPNGFGLDGVDLRPVMGLESKVVLLKTIPEGARISYGGTFVTRRPTRIAIVPIGYADGYPWKASGKAFVLVGGRRCPVVGRVTMDMIVVDVTDANGVAVNDEVVLLGGQGAERIGLAEIAGWAGTITYEILCGISKRMPRVYVGRA